MRQKNLVVLSASISFLIHLFLLVISYVIWVPGLSGITSETTRMFQVQSTELLSQMSERATISSSLKENLKFEKPVEGLEHEFVKTLVFRQKVEPVRLPAESSPLELEPVEPLETKASDDLLAIAKEEILIDQRRLQDGVSDISRHNVSGVTLKVPAAEPPDTLQKNLLTETLAPPKLDSSVLLTGSPAIPLGDNSPLPHAYGSTPSYESLDRKLTSRFFIYRDPADGQGYYQIALYPTQEGQSLEVMPKEIIFLVDASLSIQKKRLNEFKEGMQYTIDNLNAGDRFNFFFFKNSVIPFSESSVRPTSESRIKASQFLDQMNPSRTTDIYAAFLDVIRKPSRMHPSYIILLSDGNPTKGEVSSSEIIADIFRSNDPMRGIFTASGGPRVNHFLLDFLSYSNRGWSEYQPEINRIGDQVKELYEKIRNPVLSGIRYQITPLNPADVYPKNLPDFYKDTFFMLYGRFTNETRFSVRILGEIHGKTKEFIFSGDLSAAVPGDRKIAEFWALNRVYSLISQRMTGKIQDPSGASAEVKTLIKKFGLKIPYDFEKMFR